MSHNNEALFTSVYPKAAVPSLPEFMLKNTFAGMMPDEVNYPYGTGPVFVDKNTGHLYIESISSLDPDYTEPTYFGDSRSAIMRIFKSAPDGEVLDGFIADMRYMGSGTIYDRTISQPMGLDSMSAVDRIMEQGLSDDAKDKYVPLLAVVFHDPDGNIHFTGDARLEETMAHLVRTTDALKNRGDTSDQTDEPVEQISSEIPGDYYLG